MATIRRRSAGSWEIIIRRKGVLPKAHYSSASTEKEAREYAAAIEKLLDQGIVPVELQEQQDNFKSSAQTVDTWAREYLVKVAVSDSDRLLLNALLPEMETWKTNALTFFLG
ncbi:hypothetical protein [Methylocucumis oryzae]|uniref:hypothetical protein n=1 Tax=Methylocucumis oryzae TaxID=1632867 RepID=UPI0006961AFD|nr:hypothetical protein [Methylocucumis oryzae]